MEKFRLTVYNDYTVWAVTLVIVHGVHQILRETGTKRMCLVKSYQLVVNVHIPEKTAVHK